MEDMPSSPALTRILLWAQTLGMPIASVCHGPTAFLAPRDATGQSPFEGYAMTCFSHAEEFFTPINGKLPLVLEIELKRLGIRYSKAPMPWGSHVVTDRNLVTGQNPYSSEAVASTFLRHLAR
jgi:putative intracellular protease/amidase